MAEQYDNTNDGVAFPPFEDMKLILQGKINVEGRDSRYTIVRRETKTGKEIMEVYEKVGVMFKQDQGKEGSPNYTGTIYNTNDKTQPWTMPDSDKRIAAWRRQKDGKPYMSINISDPQSGSPQTKTLPRDDIPC
jgi:uncharacterized protein (DUF736 family)